MSVQELQSQIQRLEDALSKIKTEETRQRVQENIAEKKAELAALMAKKAPAPTPTPATPSPQGDDAGLQERIMRLEKKIAVATKSALEGNEVQKKSSENMLPIYRQQLAELKGQLAGTPKMPEPKAEPEIPVSKVLPDVPAARRGRPARVRPDVEPEMVKPVGRRGRPAKMRPDVEPKMVKPVGRRGRPARVRPDVEPEMVKPVARRGRPAKMRPDVEPKMVKPVGRRGRPAKIRPQEPMASILSKFNLADLNDYEKELFDEIKKNSPNLSKEVILSILISDAEGDLTQLSQGLANAARQMSQPAARRGRPAKIVKKAEPETPAPAARRGRPAKIVKQGQKELSPKSLMPLVEALITFKEQLGLGELTMQEMMDVVKLLDSNKILKYSKGGKISKNATYIPRQEIEKILLTSGVEITNDGTILSGVWKKNMKKENGGQVEIADFDDVDLEGEDYGHFVISGESAALYDGVEEFIVDDNGIYLGKMVGDNFYIILDDGTQTLAEESEWEIAYMDGGKTR
jgi:hypothetical protein